MPCSRFSSTAERRARIKKAHEEIDKNYTDHKTKELLHALANVLDDDYKRNPPTRKQVREILRKAPLDNIPVQERLREIMGENYTIERLKLTGF